MTEVTAEQPQTLDAAGLQRLLDELQDGVVSRAQLKELGASSTDIRRLLRRRELVSVHPGVYINHNGPLTWAQRAWVAVLVHWPAALARESALPVPKTDGPIKVAISSNRTVKPVAGVVAYRTARLEDRVQWSKSPPRSTIEHALIDIAATKSDPSAKFTVFANAAQKRHTTAARIAKAVRSRSHVPDKQLLLDLLDDLENGACSVLERQYLQLERLHGLPEANRQRATKVRGRSAYLDVPYDEFKLVVELDGRAFHDNSAARNRDFERDLVNAVTSDLMTVRLTHGQVFTHGCRTLRTVATLLERRGWPGPFLPCPGCESLR